MSAAKNSTSRARQHPHKRAKSLTGFLSKIFPSNRSEQGGTWRRKDAVDDHDSAYEDLGINPNELNDWNFARDSPPRRVAAATSPNPPLSHRKVQSWTPHRKPVPEPSRDTDRVGVQQYGPKLAHELGQEMSTDERPTTSLPGKSETLTRVEIEELLKSKEESRRSRRDLKESGDWLGVQGADPYSGQFSVLTPTTTLSSDTTSLSTKNRLAGLTRKKKTAQLAYEEIKVLEQEEKEKAKQEKQLSKLGKIERIKGDLRRQHDFARWSQHKRQWSSAAEPGLSPIPQSLSNLTSSNPSEVAVQPGSSHLPRPSIRVQHATSPPGSQNTQPQVSESLADRSTETIIHKSPNQHQIQNISSPPIIKAPSLPLGRGASPIRPKKEKPFLWRRRWRTIEPGGLVRGPDMGIAVPATGTYLGSNLVKQLSTSPLADVAIPDYHIHLVPPEVTEKPNSRTTSSNEGPLNKPTQATKEAMGSKPALIVKTNIPLPQAEQAHPNLGVSEATVTSSQSKSKGNMRPLSNPRSLVRSQFSITQAKDTQKRQSRTPNDNQPRKQADQNLPPEDCPGSEEEYPPLDLSKRKINMEEASGILHRIRGRIETLQRESASIPTTTTTGSAPDPQNHSVATSLLEAQTDQTAKVAGLTEGSATLKSSSERIPCIVSPTAIGMNRISSRHVTSQSGSLSPVLVQETAETGIVLTRPVTPSRATTTKSSVTMSPHAVQASEGPTTRETGGYTSTTRRGSHKLRILQNREKNSVTSPTRTFQIQFHHAQQPSQSQSQSHHQAAMLHDEEEQHTEIMIQEAARIAMLRSRAKEIVHRTPSGRATSSPVIVAKNPLPLSLTQHQPQPPRNVVLITKTELQQQQRRKAQDGTEDRGGPMNKEDDDADTGAPSKIHSSAGSDEQQQRRRRRWRRRQEEHNDREDNDHDDGPDAVVSLCRALGTALALALDLARAWWDAAVYPALDRRSEVWGRRRAGRSSWGDVGVFTSAAVFCAACAAGGWYGVGVVRGLC